MVPALSKEFLDIQATAECGFTLKLVCDMIKTYNLKEIKAPENFLNKQVSDAKKILELTEKKVN